MSLNHHIQHEDVRLQNTIGDNNKLKVLIDIMRKEILLQRMESISCRTKSKISK